MLNFILPNLAESGCTMDIQMSLTEYFILLEVVLARHRVLLILAKIYMQVRMREFCPIFKCCYFSYHYCTIIFRIFLGTNFFISFWSSHLLTSLLSLNSQLWFVYDPNCGIRPSVTMQPLCLVSITRVVRLYLLQFSN